MEIKRTVSQKSTSSTLSRVQNVFFLNGISASLDWNSILSSLDYFRNVYVGYNVYLYFPIPQFAGYLISSSIFNILTNRFGYQTLIKTGIVGTNLSLLILLAISVLYKGDISLGFYLSLLGTFILGFSNNLCQLSFYGLINYFGTKTVSRFTIGNSVSGLILISIRAIIAILFKSSQPDMLQILLYYLLGNIFNFFNLYCNIKLFNTSEYQSRQKNIPSKISQQQNEIIQNKQKQQAKNKSYLNTLWEAFNFTTPYSLMITFDIMLTFLLFPNMVTGIVTSLGHTWTGIVFIFVFNVGDLLGRLVGDFRSAYNAQSIVFLLISRLFFCYSIPKMALNTPVLTELFQNLIMPLINIFFFAFTNGLVLNGSLLLSYQRTPAYYRNHAGVLCGILWQMGLILGTFFAIPLDMYAKF